jgi:hypothetical protein
MLLVSYTRGLRFRINLDRLLRAALAAESREICETKCNIAASFSDREAGSYIAWTS